MSDLEVHKVSRHLNGQLIIGQRGKRKTDIVQIIKISTFTVFRFAIIIDKPFCLIKRSFKSTLEVHDLHRLIRIMFEHRRLQELRKSGQLTIRLDLHFIATIIDTANRFSAIKKLSSLIAVSDSQFPCAVLCLRRFAVRAEKFIDYLLQSLELFLSDSNIIITADRVLCLEIIENTLFLSRQLGMSFEERNKYIKCVLRSFLILRLIERVLRIAENTLIVGTDMVDQRTAARAFAVTNIKATLIAELLTAYDSSDREVCFFIPASFQIGDITFRVLFFIEVFEDSISKGKTAIRVRKSKIVNDVAFADPFITVTLSEMECKAVRLLFGLFRLKGYVILVLCNASKRLFCLLLITENIKQGFLNTVELRLIIAVLPAVECCTVKCSDKFLYGIIGYIGNIIFDIIQNSPICQVIKFLVDTVNESLSDLLKRNKTLHTAETAMISVLCLFCMERVTEVFSIIISTV